MSQLLTAVSWKENVQKDYFYDYEMLDTNRRRDSLSCPVCELPSGICLATTNLWGKFSDQT